MTMMQEVIRNLQDRNRRHIVNLSGGKDSTAMAIYIRQRYPQIPVEYVFCDTGCELPETYEYLERLQALLGAEIRYLNALDGLGIARKLNRNPFDIWLYEVYGGFLPNPRARWCTRVLKIEPFEDYVGKNQAFSYIGIRADENRDGYVAKKPPVISQKPNIIPIYPLRDDGIELVDIKEIIEATGLGLPEYYKWRSRSGCYFCFYQQIGEWQRLKENHPDLFEKAKAYEKMEEGKRYTWVDGRTLEDIANLPRRYPQPIAEESEGCAVCHL
jgi:3'-phosphoadenosine 5'-phosphosulfate sulfotransferase (PAPS reductase)/FAD synthetase